MEITVCYWVQLRTDPLGVAGVIAPATSALLHNTSTLGISLKSMTNLLNDQGKEKEYEEAEA